MKLPHDELRILGKLWSVVEKPELKDDEGTFLFGQCETWEQRILYSEGMTPSQLRDTIWHESLHALEETLGLGLTEAQVHALAAGQIALFRDNPWLAKWIFG